MSILEYNQSKQDDNSSTKTKITLETMDFTDKSVRLNSPLSKKALFTLGLDENKLYEITKEEYIERNKELQNAPKQLQNKRFEQFNLRRLKAIEEAKKLRSEMISDNKRLENRRSKSDIYLTDPGDYLPYERDKKVPPPIRQQITRLIKDEFDLEEIRRKYYENQRRVQENLQKVEEEKREKEEFKKLGKENMLEIIGKNQCENNLRYYQWQVDILKKQEDMIKRMKLKKEEDLMEIKRLAEERTERAKKVQEKYQLLYDLKMKELLELEKRIKLKLISEKSIVESPWKREAEGENNRKKKLMKNIFNEINNRIEFDDYKILKMKEEKEDLLKKRIEELTEKMKEKEVRNLGNLKKNGELEEIKVQKIIERIETNEEKIKKNKYLNSLKLKNKYLYLDMLKQDNLDNLRLVEKKRKFERDKIVSKLLENDQRYYKIKNNKIRNVKSYSKYMNDSKNFLIKKARLALQSGKHRNADEIVHHVLNEDEVPSIYSYINKTNIK